MSEDKKKGLLIILEETLTQEEIERIIAAASMIKGVKSVSSGRFTKYIQED